MANPAPPRRSGAMKIRLTSKCKANGGWNSLLHLRKVVRVCLGVLAGRSAVVLPKMAGHLPRKPSP